MIPIDAALPPSLHFLCFPSQPQQRSLMQLSSLKLAFQLQLRDTSNFRISLS